MKHEPFIKIPPRLKTMSEVSILPPLQVCKSSKLWGRRHKEDDDVMNIGHMFVQTTDVENNEANYPMNGKQLVATPVREDISMSLSFF